MHKFWQLTRPGLFMGYKQNRGLSWGKCYYVIDAADFQSRHVGSKCYLYEVEEVIKLKEVVFPVLDGTWKPKPPEEYEEDIFQSETLDAKDEAEEQDMDEKYDEALAIVAKDRQASISYIQRRLRIGYNRAARIIETMEREGVVGPSDGVRPREVYVSPIEIE